MFTVDHEIPSATFHQSLTTRRPNKRERDILITQGIHDLFHVEDASRTVRETRDTIHTSSTAQILQNPPRATNNAHPTRAVTNRPPCDTTIRDPGLSNVRSLSSDIFIATREVHRHWRIDAKASATGDPVPNPQRNGSSHSRCSISGSRHSRTDACRQSDRKKRCPRSTDELEQSEYLLWQKTRHACEVVCAATHFEPTEAQRQPY